MKNLIILLIHTIMLNTLSANQTQTQIERTIRSLFAATDARDWTTVESVFAPQVTLDYTSMNGGDPVVLTPTVIVNAWKGLLPGFESTHHQVGAFQIDSDGAEASASLRGLAAHYLPNEGEDVWTVVGSYDIELVKTDDDWKISLLRFNLEKQAGNTELPALAQQRAQAPAQVISTTTSSSADQAVIEEFFAALEALDIDRFMKVWAEGAQQIMPLAPAGFPEQLSGKAAIHNQYKGLPEAYTAMHFPREILTTSTPNLYIVRYQGIIPLGDGNEYNNNYVGFFTLENGLVKEFVEYFDPFILEAAFGSNLQENFNVSTAITPEPVSFPSEGAILQGNLYRPADFDDSKTYPAVVVAGTWTSVKEQMANRYAEKLAQEGFIALSFDFRGYGTSEGQPRNFENPEWKIVDIQHAVQYLEQLPEVDKDAVNGLGICAGAGYMAGAATTDASLAKISLVAPWLHNSELVQAIYGGEAGVQERLDKAQAAKARFAETGEVDYVPAISETDTEAAMYGPWDFYLNPERGAIPEWDGQFAVMAWEKWLNFDPIAMAPQVKSPTLIVHSEEAAVPDGAKQFYGQLQVEKSSYWTGGQQFDFYDGDRVDEAVQQVVKWFKQ